MKQRLQFFLTSITLLFFIGVHSQTKQWSLVSKKKNFPENELKFRKHSPSKSKVYSLNYTNFKNSIIDVSSKGNKIIELPTETGLQKFSIKEASSMAPELSIKFPMIKSYVGQGIDDPSQVSRFSLGTDGLHVVIFSAGKETFYIDPYTNDNNNYLAYGRGSLSKVQSDFECLVEEEIKSSQIKERLSYRNADDGKLRTFRLAIVCSGGYADFHLNNQGVSSTATDAVKKAAVLSAMNTTMTRVNGVFEKDLGVRMEIVANNDIIIFLDASTDGITDVDGQASTMINEVQTICDDQIGTANYDIGHIFSIAGSGLAGLGVVCINGQKARGVTGRASPIADPYDIDYVSHEIGHQFGANHTQNNSCQRNGNTAVEPGSASTIMGYAGICPPNIQSNSDDHFHSVNIDEMWATIQSSASCAVETSDGNTAPTADAGADQTIPKSTPFVLRGVGTDADAGNVLSYNWEQTDTEIATMPPVSTNTGGPAFRSNPSSTSPNRYMPALATVVAGNTSSTWEVVPSVARELNFSLVVRDNNAGGGNSARDDMKVTVDGSSGPFVVTSQTTNEMWPVDSSQTVTWDVAGTDTGNVNTPTVNILLSIDGGITFPHTLASNVPNDGSHSITVPSTGDTTTARVIVEGNNNIFYAMNSANFSIQESEFVLSVSNPAINVCSPNDAVYTITYNTFLGFSGTTTFSATGLPSGATATFSPTTATADGTVVTATISGTGSVASGSYNFALIGTSGAITKSANVSLLVSSGTPGNITLTSPSDGSTEVSLAPTLMWNGDSNTASYDVEVATDNAFTNIVSSGNVNSTSYTPTGLNQSTMYYWRVKGGNLCGDGTFSSTFSFTTLSCTACASSGNTSFETSTTLVKFNTIDNASGKPSGYSDYTSIFTIVKQGDSHTVTVNVNTDGSYRVQSKVWIDWNQDCVFNDTDEEYDLGFAVGTSDGPTNMSPLTITIPSGASIGSTVMRVSSKYTDPPPNATDYPTSCETNFDGEVEDYTVTVEPATASIEDFAFSGFNLYPNPSTGEFTLNLELINTEKVSVQLFDIRGRLINEKNYFNTNSNFSEIINFNNTAKGLYLVKITNGNKQTTRKLVIE